MKSFTMNTNDKKQFINDLMDNTKESILAKVNAMPEEWDGNELRQYIVDYAEQNAGRIPKGKRLRDYKNEVITRNL
jgi:hypothetical protein